MNYLMIENPGEAPITGLRLMGASTKDPSSDPSLIGMFGSGAKYSVLVFLRKSVYPVLFSGRDKLTFSLKPRMVGDILHKEVLIHINGRKGESMGMTLDAGKSDWSDNISMALREFFSNALDSVGGNHKLIKWAIVDESQLRARSGHTRVFIPWGLSKEWVETYLSTYFLHWRPNSTPAKGGPIEKAKPGTCPHFFRRGVLICKWSRETESLWDYNFVDLTLDESRNSNEWNLQYEAGRLLTTDARRFQETLRAIGRNPKLWESEFSHYSLESIKNNKSLTWDNSVVYVDTPQAAKLAEQKGLPSVVVPSSWVQALESANGPTVSRELGKWAKRGIEVQDALPANIRERVKYWDAQVYARNLHRGEKPLVKSFLQHPSAEKKLWGLCEPGEGIYLNQELGGEQLDTTIIEELAHWHSGSHDFTREFQEWLIRFTVRGVKE